MRPSALVGTGPGIGYIRSGKAEAWAGNGSYAFDRWPGVEGQNITFFALFKPNGTITAYEGVACKTHSNAGSTPYGSVLISRVSSNAEFQGHIAQSSGFNQSVNYGVGTNQTVSMGITKASGAQPRFFMDGVFKDAFGTTANIDYDTTSTGQVIVGGRSSAGTGNAFNGSISFVGLWARTFTDAEMGLLHENPWQVFERPSRRLYFGTAAVGGGFSYYAATQANVVIQPTLAQG